MEHVVISPDPVVVFCDEPGKGPRYLPGDIVKTRDGGIGMITEANVNVNGSSREWNDTGGFIGGGIAEYALTHIPGYPKPSYTAWWTADEWVEVVPGPLHKVINREV